MFAGIGGSGGLEDLDFGCEVGLDLEVSLLEDFDDLDLTLIYHHISTLNLRDPQHTHR